MDVSLVVQFATVAGLLAFLPGADWAYLINAGTRTRTAVPPVMGLASGYILLVAVVTVGLGALVSARPNVLTLLTVIGACYVLYLGVSMLWSLRNPVGASLVPGVDNQTGTGATAGSRREDLHQYLRGIGVSGINPKAMLMLLALLPQYLTPEGWSTTAQTGLLGSIFILEIVVVYFGVALFSRTLLRGHPRLNLAVTVFSGIFLTGFGAWLLLEALVLP